MGAPPFFPRLPWVTRPEIPLPFPATGAEGTRGAGFSRRFLLVVGPARGGYKLNLSRPRCFDTLYGMPNPSILAELPRYTREAVRFYWETRSKQSQKQREGGASDQGLRSAVTGGAQMNGFVELLTKLVSEAGIDRAHIYYQQSLELPGYFRPNKRWDFIVVVNCQLVAALEAKSQVGPSFGNNFNNRTEEAMGTAMDLWTAYRERAFGDTPRPFAGWLILVEDAPKSRTPVRDASPHFPVFPEFRSASYAERYNILCKK